MSDGKTHDRVGLIAGIICSVTAFALFSFPIAIPFFVGWLIALFIFSPDSDLMPKKRTGILAFFLYPYSILFKHRGLSHSLLLGTLSRVVYIIITFLIILFILSKMGYVEFNFSNFYTELVHFVSNFSVSNPIYQVLCSFYAGMFGADLVHIILDTLSSFLAKLKREVL